MNQVTLAKFLNLNQRKQFYFELLKKFEDLSDLNQINYEKYRIPSGYLPLVRINGASKRKNVKYVKVFVAAQHNEFNGLFGILNFLREIKENGFKIDKTLYKNQTLLFFPLMNIYGFLHPQKQNKSGYFLKNGSNLNRFWRKIFVPEFDNSQSDLDQYDVPKQTEIVKKILQPYWNNKNVAIYLMDFHETSLLDRFMKNLSKKLNQESFTYKFTHWLEKEILLNVIKLNNLKLSRRNLFFKCNPQSDHEHLNLSMKEINLVYEKLLNYVAQNKDKLSFYFCYSNRSKQYCRTLADKIYKKLRKKLWNTLCPAYSHDFHNYGCFVNMSKATKRNNFLAMELESKKQFFNIFEEINSSQRDPTYFEKKISSINISIELVNETIKGMIKFF